MTQETGPDQSQEEAVGQQVRGESCRCGADRNPTGHKAKREHPPLQRASHQTCLPGGWEMAVASPTLPLTCQTPVLSAVHGVRLPPIRLHTHGLPEKGKV